MGSSLSPAVANLFMVYFEKKAIETANLKPKLWIRYVDDVFVVWSFGKDELLNFLHHLNSIHPRIQFTIELEENNQIPFLDVQVTKTSGGHLAHTVYRKPTHTNRYLNAESHHHPSQKQSVINTLISRSLRLSDDSSKENELKQITTALKKNGYKQHAITQAIKKQQQPPRNILNDKPKITLPYIKGTTDRIGRLLRRHNIPTAFKPHQTIRSTLRNPKDKTNLENQGVYSIACGTCQKQYVGQTNRRISARLEEHKLAIKNKQTTSALFQHQHHTGHKIDFESCKQLANIEHYRTRTIREAIEIHRIGELNSRNDALNLSDTWKALINKTTIPYPSIVNRQLTPARTPDNPTEGAELTAPTNQNRYNLRRRQQNLAARC